MEFSASVDAGRRVRLGYGLNLHAPRTLAELQDGLRAVTLPLKARVAPHARFGVGMYLPAELAHALDPATGREGSAALADFLAEHALDAFTFNAFPYARFQEDGLKERVFQPAWWERDRLDYTLAVARVATELARAASGPRSHVSISTHCGQFGAFEDGSAKELAAIAHLAHCALEFARMEERGAPRLVLALEPEPRSSCNDLEALARFFPRLCERGARFLEREHGVGASRAEALLRRHVGTCLDACHAAVEFEDASVVDPGTGRGVLGKLQFTSALRVPAPATNARGRAALLALDEPRFLHQTTGRSATGRLRANDLGELRSPSSAWLACDEWRCHFHVPVDLDEARDEHGAPLGLATTRAFADELLARALAGGAWALAELHVEIETYTWDVLPAFAARARGPEALVDGLAREYAHVVGQLGRAGWLPAGSCAPKG
ncbi:MAG: metabolite traffic protein EboE [Planctomycetes bacterium]|nr:metabolite traffic protein EboE [Planctomycetota bacterium]